MSIQPVNDYLLIQPDTAPSKTATGIYIPETADKEKPQRAKVVAAGPGKINTDGSRQEMSAKKGDTILYTKYGPTEVTVDGEELVFIQDSDIIATI